MVAFRKNNANDCFYYFCTNSINGIDFSRQRSKGSGVPGSTR